MDRTITVLAEDDMMTIYVNTQRQIEDLATRQAWQHATDQELSAMDDLQDPAADTAALILMRKFRNQFDELQYEVEKKYTQPSPTVIRIAFHRTRLLEWGSFLLHDLQATSNF